MDQQVRPDGLTVPEWLLSPEHAARMGGALWVFLWLWREGTAWDGPFVREVRGGAPVRVEEIAAALGLSRRSVERSLAQLREAGYLTTFREHHAFTAVVSLWQPGDKDYESTAISGGSLGESQPPNLAVDCANQGSTAKSGGSHGQCQPPNLAVDFPPLDSPLKEEELLSRLPVKECSSLPDPGFLLRTSNSKRATVVPIRPGVAAEGPPAGKGAVAAVVAGPSPHRLQHEQAILHHLGRIEAWERPEPTPTLLDALLAVPPGHLAEVFELCWRKHRYRNKALDNPAGWWAAMLTRTAQAVAKVAAQEEGHA